MNNGFIFTILLCLFLTKLHAQNYTQDSGFESMDNCGELNNVHNGGPDALMHCFGWVSAAGSPDLYATCGVPQFTDIPSNMLGNQTTHQGTKYCGAITLSFDGYYEYLGNQLIAPLEPGTVYEVSYYVSKAEIPGWASNNLGVVFTTASYSELTNPYTQRNFSHIRDTNVVTNETGWTRISGTFVADSAYTFMIMGNLYDSAHTQIISGLGHWGGGDPYCYYYFDDVCVVPLGGDCSTPVSVSQPHQPSTFSAFPNPIIKSQSSILRFSKESSVEVYDLVGQKVAYYENVMEIDAGTWAAGVYFLKEKGGG